MVGTGAGRSRQPRCCRLVEGRGGGGGVSSSPQPRLFGVQVPGSLPEGVPGAGGDGGAGGGEPSGSQRHAEDGPALLLRSLAAL